jgi:isopentenyl-diphosphate delta-isomerase
MNAYSGAAVIDRVDARDQRVGVVPRRDALAVGANFRTAHVFIFSDEGQLLLQRLAPSRERHAGRWGSSVAAYVLAGESYRHAAERRMAQELGLRRQLTPLGKVAMRDGRSLKFVGLFSARDGDAAIHEPGHIAALAYWNVADIHLASSREPELFTPTFLELFRYARAERIAGIDL